MAEYSIQDSTLIAIADAIRAKTGNAETLSPSQMATEISSIPGSKLATTTTFSKADSVVTESSTLEDGTTGVSYITFDEDGYPISVTGGDDSVTIAVNYDDAGIATSVTVDGTECPVTWEGFDG